MIPPVASALALLHPACVHFPIALLIVGGLWEAWGCWFGREAAIRAGGVLTILGTLTLLPTIITGYLAVNSVPVPMTADRTLDLHELNGWVVLGLFVALLFWKGWNRGTIPRAQRRPYALFQLVCVSVVVLGAVLGGKLVYLYGIGTRVAGH